MKNDEKIKNKIIDEYFKDKPGENCDDFGNSIIGQKFTEKLNSAMSYMDSFDFDKIETNFNTEKLIILSEKIIEERKRKKDVFRFTLLGAVLISLMALITLIYGVKTIFYLQIIIWTNLPLLLIPFITKSGKGGNIL